MMFYIIKIWSALLHANVATDCLEKTQNQVLLLSDLIRKSAFDWNRRKTAISLSRHCFLMNSFPDKLEMKWRVNTWKGSLGARFQQGHKNSGRSLSRLVPGGLRGWRVESNKSHFSWGTFSNVGRPYTPFHGRLFSSWDSHSGSTVVKRKGSLAPVIPKGSNMSPAKGWRRADGCQGHGISAGPPPAIFRLDLYSCELLPLPFVSRTRMSPKNEQQSAAKLSLKIRKTAMQFIGFWIRNNGRITKCRINWKKLDEISLFSLKINKKCPGRSTKPLVQIPTTDLFKVHEWNCPLFGNPVQCYHNCSSFPPFLGGPK